MRANSLTFGVILIAALLLDIRYNPANSSALSFTIAEFLAWGFLLFAFATTPLDLIYRRYFRPAWQTNSAVLLWTGWALFAGLMNALLLGRSEALQLTKDMVPGLIAFLFLSSGIRRRTDWAQVERMLLIGLLGLGLLGTAQTLLGGPYPVVTGNVAYQKLDLDGNFVGKVALGLSHHPNNFGALIAPPLAFAIILFAANPLRFRPLLWGATLFGLIGLYGTAMKGAFFWLPFALLLASLPRKLLTSTGFAFAVALVAYGLVHFALESRTDLVGTILTRYGFWETALENLRTGTSWLIGTDIQQVAYDNFSKISWEFPHSHMAYLNYALYFGWPAAALFVAAIYLGIRNSVSAAKRLNSSRAGIARASIAALLTIAGIGVLESTVEPSRFGIIYIFLALAGRQAKLARGSFFKRDPRRQARTRRSTALPQYALRR